MLNFNSIKVRLEQYNCAFKFRPVFNFNSIKVRLELTNSQ